MPHLGFSKHTKMAYFRLENWHRRISSLHHFQINAFRFQRMQANALIQFYNKFSQ